MAEITKQVKIEAVYDVESLERVKEAAHILSQHFLKISDDFRLLEFSLTKLASDFKKAESEDD